MANGNATRPVTTQNSDTARPDTSDIRCKLTNASSHKSSIRYYFSECCIRCITTPLGSRLWDWVHPYTVSVARTRTTELGGPHGADRLPNMRTVYTGTHRMLGTRNLWDGFTLTSSRSCCPSRTTGVSVAPRSP
eukprot:1037657-Prymnesium_polylepis.1